MTELTPIIHGATNDMIVPYALLRHHADSKTRAFSTVNSETYSVLYKGELSRKLYAVLRDRMYGDKKIKQVIYSYDTPIAWLDGDVWVVPHVTYSATTSSKHQSRLHRLTNRVSVPEDVAPGEYMRVLAGKMVFDYRNNRTLPGPNFTI